MTYEELCELLRGGGMSRTDLLQTTDDATAIRLVMEGVVPVEALNDLKRSGWAHPAHAAALAATAARDQEQRARASIDKLDPDVGIAPCLAGIDDPEAAVAMLPLVPTIVIEAQKACPAATGPGDVQFPAVKATPAVYEDRIPEWAIEDGYLFVRGSTSEAVAAALLATRP